MQTQNKQKVEKKHLSNNIEEVKYKLKNNNNKINT